ncbi:hypothetical protein [Coxiella-like endosymbiont]|uniref:hypothetical protein n=1 Tax=Coxiella-like endosymbiont TaxID=1592897 RepID=UPI002868EA8F|nr:hypothetical protein [Coxiella-like endosymbiont]
MLCFVFVSARNYCYSGYDCYLEDYSKVTKVKLSISRIQIPSSEKEGYSLVFSLYGLVPPPLILGGKNRPLGEID